MSGKLGPVPPRTVTEPLIPLVDLGWEHDEIATEVADGWRAVVSSTRFVGGPAVDAFERAFAHHAGTARCVTVGSGTDALELGLRAVGVGRGDVVVLPANTFVATAEAVVRAGATLRLVDCEPDHGMIDPDQATAAMVGARALVAVHLFGQVAPLDDIVRRGADVGCSVVEDAAHAHGATRDGRGIGSWGRLAATSFYPSKNLGAYGDGGAVLTSDDTVADTVHELRDHGAPTVDRRVLAGCTSRLDALQAVVLLAKLRRLRAWNARRAEVARRYDQLLGDLARDGDVLLPSTLPGNEHAWHLYVVRLPHGARDRVAAALQADGIGVGVHYREPVHLAPAFRALGVPVGACPVAEQRAREMLSLPMGPGITEAQQSRVVGALAGALRGPG